MVSSLLTLAIFGAVALSGRSTLACIILASIAMLCLAYSALSRQSSASTIKTIALLFENLMLIVGYSRGCELEQSWAVVLPAAFLFVARLLTRRTLGDARFMFATLPFLLLAANINDSDVSAWLCLGTALAAPIPSMTILPKPFSMVWLMSACSVFLLSILIPLSVSVTDIKTAMLRGGEWADPNEGEPFPANLTQKASYSYSSLKSLLAANVIDLDSLGPTYGEAWLITPTKPLTPNERRKLSEWVHQGGHLIAVSDHTDLFGHGRVLRDVLSEFGIANSLTAFFPTEGGAGVSPGWLVDGINIKTSNVQHSVNALPLITDRWWNEQADYSSPNFFGPLTPSVDDHFGRRMISCRASYGAGTVTVHGDSTVFANFAMFQPHTPELVQKLRAIGISHKLWPWVPWMLLLGGLVYRLTGRHEAMVIAVSILVVPTLDGRTTELKWERYIWVSGQPSVAFESGSPTERFSTAYAVLGLSGLAPRWIDKPVPGTVGLILGEAKVPFGWKQITATKSAGIVDDGLPALAPLYAHLTKVHPIKPFTVPDSSAASGSLWTDDVMGDWWFDRGVSDARRQRFQSLIAWLNGNPFTYSTSTSNSWDLEHTKDYWLVLATGDEIKLHLPTMTAQVGSKLYLGRGVSAEIVDQEGKKVMLGTAATTEAWGAPYSWVLVPVE